MDGYKITILDSKYEEDIRLAFSTSKSVDELMERLRRIGKAHSRDVILKMPDGSDVVIN
ncbi:hypothetical protein [Vibrio crassostreae]|uniref:hypothetical protein n=1 Tax=Vibrio crassostreae TaxID=246167 RepID=UPI00063A1608|nr:hypothetical protein [Vibrio crassostreae]CDT52085.1 hypothetical protein VCRLGP8_40006 [Vibrio crassostreae]